MSFTYLLNDPSRPDLSQLLESFPLPEVHPNFNVQGWSGFTGNQGSVEAQAAQVYVTIAYVLSFVQKSLNSPQLNHWPGTNNLTAIPRAGQDMNAYYDRTSLRFFYGPSAGGKMIYTCESTDIVAHETGHGILDQLRPDLWSVPSLEIMAFHESFADCISLLKALQHDAMIIKMLDETGGDIKKANVVANLAEEMGSVIYPQHPTYLRCAANDFVYIKPEQLPRSAPDGQLSQEPHSFSRVFTGMFWEILSRIYERYAPSDKMTAVKTSRDIMSRLLLNAVTFAPSVPNFYKSVGQSMIIADKNLHNSSNSDIIQLVLSRRGMSKDIIFMVPEGFYSEKETLPGSKIFTIGREKVIRNSKILELKLHERPELKYEKDNPLYDAKIDVPNESMIHLDEKNHRLGAINPDLSNVIKCAQVALDYIHLRKDNSFVVKDGKLTRLRVCNHN